VFPSIRSYVPPLHSHCNFGQLQRRNPTLLLLLLLLLKMMMTTMPGMRRAVSEER
jgi:hypothetical protein